MEFELEVRNLNDDPVAVIASPADGDIFVSGEEISFDGTASTDEDSIHGDSLRYRWQKDNKMLGEDDLFTDTIDKPGDYTIKLTVYDDAGRSSQTSVDITVEEDPTAIDDELPDGTDGAEPDATDGEEEDGSGEATTDKEGSTLMGMKTGYAVAVLAMVAVMIVVVLLGVILLTKKPPVPPPGTAPPPGAFPPQGPAQQGAMQTEYMGTGTQPDLYGSGTGTAPAPQPGMGSAPGSEAGAGLSGQTADNTLLLPPPNS